MKVIVGLGNPGAEYERTRHNVGWWVVDHLADVWHFDGWRRDGEARVANGTVAGTKVRLIKPLTYMNLSGSVLKPYARRPFWAAATDLMVVVDEAACLALLVPAGGHDLLVDGLARRRPPRDVGCSPSPVLGGLSDPAVEGDPAHHPSVRERLVTAACLPDARVGLVPVLGQPVEDPGERLEAFVAGGQRTQPVAS